LVSPGVKRYLGFKDDTPDEVVAKEWQRRTKHVCKPCWELNYCPYGPLVEKFPLYETRQEKEEFIKELKKDLKSGEYDRKVRRMIELSKTNEDKELREEIKDFKRKLLSSKLDKKTKAVLNSLVPGIIPDAEYKIKEMRKWAEEEIQSFNPKEYPEKIDYVKECMIFGHYCPVFFVNEPFTETSTKRKITRKFSRGMFLRIVRRDNQTCQICNRHLKEDDIEIDHVIPHSLGGPTVESNLRVVCKSCNRKRGSIVEL
jgi:hypothetical protein